MSAAEIKKSDAKKAKPELSVAAKSTRTKQLKTQRENRLGGPACKKAFGVIELKFNFSKQARKALRQAIVCETRNVVTVADHVTREIQHCGTITRDAVLSAITAMAYTPDFTDPLKERLSVALERFVKLRKENATPNDDLGNQYGTGSHCNAHTLLVETGLKCAGDATCTLGVFMDMVADALVKTSTSFVPDGRCLVKISSVHEAMDALRRTHCLFLRVRDTTDPLIMLPREKLIAMAEKTRASSKKAKKKKAKKAPKEEADGPVKEATKKKKKKSKDKKSKKEKKKSKKSVPEE